MVVAKQLLRSGTSAAANHREAKHSRSKAERIAKFNIVLHELEESALWLELLSEHQLANAEGLRQLLDETNELISILWQASKPYTVVSTMYNLFYALRSWSVAHMDKIRILIADDHPVFRFGLHALLNAMPDTEVVGEVTSGQEAIAAAASTLPDVVLMDINMPGINGIEATRQIREVNPDIRILIVTMLEDDSVFAAMRAGARGYVVKGAEPAEMLRAIRGIAGGEAIFSPGIAERLIHYFANPPSAPRAPSLSAAVPLFPELTEREREVLGLIAQGLTNSAIAERLVLSPKTVRNYVTEIFSKLQVADRAQAIIRARDAGLG
jgi:four helix bundle protein